MDLDDLHIFRCVVREGGVTRAADRLHRVPSNVTTRIKQFEQRLGVSLFRRQGLPLPVTADAFSPRAMPRPIPGQAGAQFFFPLGGRAFCLFVVIGSYVDRERLVPQVNAVVQSITVE